MTLIPVRPGKDCADGTIVAATDESMAGLPVENLVGDARYGSTINSNDHSFKAESLQR